ncbi:putative baseplate assembly protein [Oculatella sp. LEGE 06141]|uniref:putative baseplate assembly protein n=1 Tax=Oculatella sp. LEGE 06141 TaxID=1828648 RepID=UPI0018830074|nr:putative baseplate assembly protein [Oculatella sp. LEGE 06141]MBE9180048.1 putative baseplate assembly protein [Oculatella sp. LEGE 06141]
MMTASTSPSPLTCQNEQRRYAVRDSDLNGLDYLEVSDDQLTLTIYFLGKAPDTIRKENVQIDGGRRIQDIRVEHVQLHHRPEPDEDDWMMVTVNHPGDFSPYRLRVVDVDAQGRATDRPLSGFDERYAHLEFNFKVNCPSDLDCQTSTVCPPEAFPKPEISYLAKDYASFRRLILDRLSLLLPHWQERHIPDLGITLVELLAYVGDYLSYYQDAVATEAYLETAQQRISVRRHARLMDYALHEGCNARAWIHVAIADSNESCQPDEIYFITSYNDAPEDRRSLTQDELRSIPWSEYEVFEPIALRPHPGIEIHPEDLIDIKGLITQLQQADDPLSAYLHQQFSAYTRRLLREYDATQSPSHSLHQTLAAELNRQIKSDRLYTAARFAHVLLSAGTERRLQQQPQGDALQQLHRWLLEEAYPQAIAKSKLYFYEAHNQISIYTWGDRQCCLPHGSTSATLEDRWIEVSLPPPPDEPQPDAKLVKRPPKADSKGNQDEPSQQKSSVDCPPAEPIVRRRRTLNLVVGDVLIFEEIKGAKTGNPADANPAHRHAVRLTQVQPTVDRLTDRPIVNIEWAIADALPFPLCVSAIGSAPDCALMTDISVARGNVVLVDHGRTIEAESLGRVPVAMNELKCEGEGRLAETRILADRFQPRLEKVPLTFSQPLSIDSSATDLLHQDPRRALPQIQPLHGLQHRLDRITETQWSVQPDLLSSRPDDYHVVVEVDQRGMSHLRFGDGKSGRKPDAETTFTATYRMGNGRAGNVGAEAITYLVWRHLSITGLSIRPRNPFPAQRGTDAEPIAEAKLFAPHALRRELQRAITAEDYARLAEQHPQVQKAFATLRWMGSWYEVLVAIDPIGSTEMNDALLQEIAGYLHRYRRMGHELIVAPAQYVPLDLALLVCVLPHYLRAQVKAQLLEQFSNRRLPNGQLGFFHPDNLTFGSAIALSQIIAIAQSVPGVESVTVTTLERLYEGANREIETGVLPIHPMEIARLDNDPNFPENGRLQLEMRGGR